jgi:TetR/AcrR family transcriptional regulator, transcriptional repressor of bet genes
MEKRYGMPKQVDHQERRQQIADAVCRLAARQGLEAVSLRHVAAEAGVSMGQVQHYFATKDEMLMFAFRAFSERAERRLAAAVTAAAGPEPSPRSLLRALLAHLVSPGEEFRAEAPVWAAFLARAVVEPRIGEILREGGREMTGFLAAQLRAAQAAGESPAGLDPEREAVTLLTLSDGLLLAQLIGHVDSVAALSAMDGQLDRIFPTA